MSTVQVSNDRAQVLISLNNARRKPLCRGFRLLFRRCRPEIDALGAVAVQGQDNGC